MPRAEIFITDKISFAESYTTDGVKAALASSLSKLRTDYLDLVLLHSVQPRMNEVCCAAAPAAGVCGCTAPPRPAR